MAETEAEVSAQSKRSVKSPLSQQSGAIGVSFHGLQETGSIVKPNTRHSFNSMQEMEGAYTIWIIYGLNVCLDGSVLLFHCLAPHAIEYDSEPLLDCSSPHPYSSRS